MKAQLSEGPGDRPYLAAEITKLLTAFPRREEGDDTLSLRIDAYFEALAGAPVWAVQQARLRVIRGDVGSLDTRFAPTPPQFAELVRQVTQPLRDDLADLERLAAAVVEHTPTDEERARVAAGFHDLKRSLPTGREREAKSEAALSAHADGQLRQRLRGMGKTEAEIDEAMDALKPAPVRDGALRPLKAEA